jgi:alkylation response protein AidB-like acyl-CoA dehydrogenase
MITAVKQAQLLLYDTAWRYDHRRGGSWMERALSTCMVKSAIPDLALDILKRAIDIFGGYGYFEEMGLEGAYRDTRITPIYEGTVEMQLDVMSNILHRVDMNYLSKEFF